MATKQLALCCGVSIAGVFGALLSTVSTAALAMNQEGHDGGWMSDFPPALALLEAIPEARPLPTRICPVTADMLARNQYEQIPLPRHRCPKNQLPASLLTYPAAAR
jgi:hypothetical protein